MLNSQVNIAMVVSRFNSEITDKLRAGAFDTLIQSGISKEQINVVEVPGAVEIPLVAKLLAASKKYHSIICLGAVIRGETNHYEYVCQQVSNGCQQVMMEFNLPVIFGVLTTKNMKQAYDRVDVKKEHKGIEAANAALSMINLMATI